MGINKGLVLVKIEKLKLLDETSSKKIVNVIES